MASLDPSPRGHTDLCRWPAGVCLPCEGQSPKAGGSQARQRGACEQLPRNFGGKPQVNSQAYCQGEGTGPDSWSAPLLRCLQHPLRTFVILYAWTALGGQGARGCSSCHPAMASERPRVTGLDQGWKGRGAHPGRWDRAGPGRKGRTWTSRQQEPQMLFLQGTCREDRDP